MERDRHHHTCTSLSTGLPIPSSHLNTSLLPVITPRYIDHFMYKGQLCIVTDYCERGDLQALLKGRAAPLPEPDVLRYLAQAALALQHVHSRAVLHRDLKTQNIFLTRDGAVKLGDFGIARPLDSTHELASTVIGTPYYMSPELMQSRPYDYKSDIWSLGCVVFEMMTLRHAFDATDMSTLVMKILQVSRGMGEGMLRRVGRSSGCDSKGTTCLRPAQGIVCCWCAARDLTLVLMPTCAAIRAAGRPPAHPWQLQPRAEGLCQDGAEQEPCQAALSG
jgi:serine/threonine protein kinase